LLANSKNKDEILASFDIMKKNLVGYLNAVGASEEIIQYAETQAAEFEALAKWDGISPHKHFH
jgi:hypothetical protein